MSAAINLLVHRLRSRSRDNFPETRIGPDGIPDPAPFQIGHSNQRDRPLAVIAGKSEQFLDQVDGFIGFAGACIDQGEVSGSIVPYTDGVVDLNLSYVM